MACFRLFLLSVLATLLVGCAEPAAQTTFTDCIKVAQWVELGLKAESLINDATQDDAYNTVVAERKTVADSMSAHDLRFGETLISQIDVRGSAPYADIYGLCRKWETGNY